MPTYVMFFGFTPQGIANIKDSPARVEEAKKTCESMGVRVKQFYAIMGMGQYDTMFIVEGGDDEAVARAALAISSRGSVHTNTLRAFTEQEYGKMISGLP